MMSASNELDFDFADFDAPMAADVSLDELLKRAEEEVDREMQQQQHQEPDKEMEDESAPQMMDTGNEDLGAVEALLGASASGNGKDQPKEKKKRIIPKLTEAMMMGPHGLTNLIHRANKFKKRSSNEKTLDAFMEMMQIWGHELFPKERFSDFIQTSQKLCTKRGMRDFRDREIREARRQKNGYYDSIITKSANKSTPVADFIQASIQATSSASANPAAQADINDDYDDEMMMMMEQEAMMASSLPAVPLQPGMAGAPSVGQENTPPELNLTSNVSVVSDDKLAIIEINRQKALAKLAERQRQREEERKAKERAEEVAKMLGESRHLFSL